MADKQASWTACDTGGHCLPGNESRDLGRQFFMESIIVACITGVVTLAGVILSNSKSRAVMEVKLDALTAKVEKHNQVLERTYRLEQDMAVAKHDIESLKGKAGWHERVPGKQRLALAPGTHDRAGSPGRGDRQPGLDHGLVRARPEHAWAHDGAGDGGLVSHHGRTRRRRRQAGDPEG